MTERVTKSKQIQPIAVGTHESNSNIRGQLRSIFVLVENLATFSNKR